MKLSKSEKDRLLFNKDEYLYWFSKPETDLLENLYNGYRVFKFIHWPQKTFTYLLRRKPEEPLKRTTIVAIRKLIKRGLLKRNPHREFIINNAGRAALEAEGER